MHLKNYAIGILVIAIISSLILVLFPFTKSSILNREPELQIAYLKSNIDCTAEINLNNGQSITLNISEKIPKCIRLYPPEVSLDNKYAAFSLDTPIADEHNQVIIFFVDKKDWVKVYDYGSASNVGMSFDREHNLLLSLSKGQMKESKTIVVPDIQTHFDQVDPVTKEIHFSESFPEDSIIK